MVQIVRTQQREYADCNLTVSVTCPSCKGTRIIRKGHRQTRNRGKIQKYQCKTCQRFFTFDDGFHRMRNHPDRITQAIDTYYEGLSSRKTARNLKKYTRTRIHHTTVLDWLRRYTLKVTKYLNTLQPVLGDRQYTDETVIRTGGEEHNYGIVMDQDTRYITATRYWNKQVCDLTSADLAEFWKDATKHHRPKKWRTDGHGAYNTAFKKTFYTPCTKLKVQWERHVTSKTGKFNYAIERLNRNLKDRLRTIYGFKQLWSAPILLQGWVIHYNHVRTHMGIRCTPAHKAGIQLSLDENRWLGLIRLSQIVVF